MLVLNLKLDGNFLFTIESQQELKLITVPYLVIGPQPASVCPTGQSGCGTWVYVKECVQECPEGTLKVDYADGGRACRNCPGDYFLSADTKYCECITDENGRCYSKDDGTSEVESQFTN